MEDLKWTWTKCVEQIVRDILHIYILKTKLNQCQLLLFLTVTLNV